VAIFQLLNAVAPVAFAYFLPFSHRVSKQFKD